VNEPPSDVEVAVVASVLSGAEEDGAELFAAAAILLVPTEALTFVGGVSEGLSAVRREFKGFAATAVLGIAALGISLPRFAGKLETAFSDLFSVAITGLDFAVGIFVATGAIAAGVLRTSCEAVRPFSIAVGFSGTGREAADSVFAELGAAGVIGELPNAPKS
jgi:hypothetical protein